MAENKLSANKTHAFVLKFTFLSMGPDTQTHESKRKQNLHERGTHNAL